ncbi:MAG TPA: flagellar hook-associated protein FlgK [Nitrospirales bacterium]|jgi:flagellar hook-associated protein 1 FlgK
MAGLLSIFNTGANSLLAHQRALQVVSQNLANLNTPGFSRQEAVFAPTETVTIGKTQIGTGVEVTQIRRVVNTFVEQQLNVSQQDLGRLQTQADGFVRLEGLFPDTADQGLNKALTELFNAFRDVSTSPEGFTQRTVLLNKASALTAQFNQASNALSQLRRDLNAQVSQTITDVNGKAAQIAVLNGKITTAEASGQTANDLRDRRGQLLNELGKQIEIHTFEDASGQVSVFVGRGNLLVERNTTYALAGSASASNGGFLNVFYKGNDISPFIGNGALNGLISQRDTTIPDVLNQIDTLAATLTNEVNKLHVNGFGLDASTGNNFFSPLSVTAIAQSTNTGTATIGSAAITANGLLTMHNYEIQFSSPTAYSIVDSTTGGTIKGNYTGTAITAPTTSAPALVTTGTNDTLNVTVDGVASGLITLTGAAAPGKAYPTGADLATELQTQINADATLAAAGKNVTVSFDTTTKRFVIASTSASATSAVDVTAGSARATLGLLAGTSTAASGTYTSPATFNFDGISVRISGTTAADDVFAVNTTEDTAKNLGVALTDPTKVAASATQSGLPTDGANAFAIIALQNQTLATLGNGTLTTYYSSVASTVGTNAQSNNQALKAQEAVQNQLDNLRGQTSGVSIDEELTKMLEFQRLYQASARLVTVADELLVTLLDIK